MPRTGLSPEEARQRAVEIAVARIRENGFVKLRLADVAVADGDCYLSSFCTVLYITSW